MNSEISKNVQDIWLQIAVEIKRVCTQLGIIYFLNCDTLLGVVRFNGFLPWGKGFQIGMLRRDYDRFVKEAESILDKKYYLKTYKNDENYADSIAKVGKMNTKGYDDSLSETDEYQNICVDIMAYDIYPEAESERQKQGAFLDKHIKYLQAKTKFCVGENLKNKFELFRLKFKWGLCRLLVLNKSKERIISEYEKELEKYNGSQSEYMHAHTIEYLYGKLVIPKECFDEFIELPFEGVEFTCPGDCDLFLKAAYGNYMMIPTHDTE